MRGQSWLESYHPPSNWLLVINNACDEKNLAYRLEWNGLCVLVENEFDACLITLFDIRVEAHSEFTKLHGNKAKGARWSVGQ